MTPSKKLKELAKKTGKSLSMKATKKIQILLEERALEILKKSARKSDFAGRKTIKEQDITD
ncbi:NFYB/HAP3 family transcription factor subunit [Candidatus Pacearchaeota archaeon]|nr:NFYB/HAP3 family transcription factor subunit [Candidatus Pacearchaeota archaeon]